MLTLYGEFQLSEFSGRNVKLTFKGPYTDWSICASFFNIHKAGSLKNGDVVLASVEINVVENRRRVHWTGTIVNFLTTQARIPSSTPAILVSGEISNFTSTVELTWFNQDTIQQHRIMIPESQSISRKLQKATFQTKFIDFRLSELVSIVHME